MSIASTDAAASHAAVGELASQLRKSGAVVVPATIPGTDAAVGVRLTGLPVVLDIASGRDSAGAPRLVLGLAEPSVEAALNPSSTLASAPSRAAAAASLGEGIQPSLIVNLPTLLSLFESIGLLEGPPISTFVPYLRSVTTIAGGGHELSNEVARYRLILNLQAAG